MQRVIDQTEQLLDDLAQGWSLPASWYTDPAVVELEQEHIFRKSWQYAGHAGRLAAHGDYLTGYVGEIPIVVVRNQEGIEGFVNVCRHRRHEVMSGCGNAKIMQCPYHAWTYDLRGCLKAAPRSDREPSFQIEEFPLLPIKVEQLGPFVFVNADINAEPLDSYFGGVLDLISHTGIDLNSLKLWSHEEWTSDSNWKSMLENYLECYHCPVAHPGFSAAIDVDPDSYKLTPYDWYMSQVGYVRQAALEGKTKVKIYDARGAIVEAQYHLLWPNFTININPGYPNLSVDVWYPDGPSKAKGFSQQFFGPDVSEDWARELVEFNKKVGEEDDELTNSVQRGMAAGRPVKGRFLTNSEHLIIHFQKLVVKALAAK